MCQAACLAGGCLIGNLAITGVSGYIGGELARLFSSDADVQRVIGIDVAPAPCPPIDRLEHHQRSVAEPFADLFVGADLDAAVHLAFILDPIKDVGLMERVNLEGTRHFFDACEQAGTPVVLVVTSATAYGAHPDNPPRLAEDSPLRARADFAYAWHKRQQEALCEDFGRRNPGTQLIVARPAVVMGPNMNNWMSRLLDQPSFIAPRGLDPPLQFVHEQDVVGGLRHLLKRGRGGVYNLGADGTLPMSQVAALAGKPVRRMPYRLLWVLAGLCWRLGLKRFGEAPAGWLPYVSYPWVVANNRLKEEAGYRFRYDSEQTLRHFLESRPTATASGSSRDATSGSR